MSCRMLAPAKTFPAAKPLHLPSPFTFPCHLLLLSFSTFLTTYLLLPSTQLYVQMFRLDYSNTMSSPRPVITPTSVGCNEPQSFTAAIIPDRSKLVYFRKCYQPDFICFHFHYCVFNALFSQYNVQIYKMVQKK